MADFPPGTNLVGADLTGADLRGSDLSDASCYGDCADFRRANLTGADLRDCQLGVPDFSDANLTDANLAGIDIKSAPEVGWPAFTGATLVRTDLSGTRLVRARMVGANLTEANLTRAVLIGADFTSAILVHATLVSADLRGALLRDADLRGADLTGTVLPDSSQLSWGDLQGGLLGGPNAPRTQRVRLDLLHGMAWDTTTIWPDARTAAQLAAASMTHRNGVFTVVSPRGPWLDG